DGGETLKGTADPPSGAVGSVRTLVTDRKATPLVHVFSARHEFADEWHRFLQSGKSLFFDLTDAVPFQPARRPIGITQLAFFVKANGALIDTVPKLNAVDS